jgi:hypothetical protein
VPLAHLPLAGLSSFGLGAAEAALATVEKPYPSTAAGLTIVVAWGLPYFRTFVNGPWQAKGPRDLDPNLPLVNGQRQFAVLDAIRFPSDPATTVLEDNEVAFKIRSDQQSIVQSVETQLFANPSDPAYVGDLFDLTSKRIGFAGRGFGTTSAAKTLALAAGVPSAASIPDRAQLMMGFTSTQPDALGPDNIVSFETLKGVTDQWPSGYFAHGCAMHLSHLEPLVPVAVRPYRMLRGPSAAQRARVRGEVTLAQPWRAGDSGPSLTAELL